MSYTVTCDNQLYSSPSEIGVTKDRVDPYTLYLIEYLFPGRHGVKFLASLLQQATIKQLALPELDLPEITDVAVITSQNLRKLSALLGVAYDTTEKYIVVLCTLRLLDKQRSQQQTVLHFPLCHRQLPEPEVLDTLAYRPKVTTFAAQIKRRLMLLRQPKPLHQLASLQTITAMTTSTSVSLAPLLVEDIRTILQQEVDPKIQSRLLPSIEQAIHARCLQMQRRLSAPKDDFSAEQPTAQHVIQGQESPSASQKDDFFSSASNSTAQQSRLFAQKDDFFSSASNDQLDESPFGSKKDDFFERGPQQQSRLLAGKDDFLSEQEITQRQKSPFDSEKDDSLGQRASQERRLFAEKDDFLPAEGSLEAKKTTFLGQKDDFAGSTRAVSFNDNVLSPYRLQKEDPVSDNDAPNAPVVASHHSEVQGDRYTPREAASIGRHLALFLEKTPQNTGGFVNKCKQYGPTIIRAAVVDVLVHEAFPTADPADERGRPRNRAKWFHEACKTYGGERSTSIPAFVLRWVKTDLSWQEIEQQLAELATRYKRYMVERTTADLVRQCLRGELDQQALDAALQGSLAPTTAHSAPASSQQATSVSSTLHSAPSKPELPAVNHATPAPKTWMDEYEAEALAEEVLRDAGPLGVTTAKAVQEQGVFVVELRWRGARMTMKTPQQWRTHLEKTKHALALQQQIRAEREKGV